MSILKIKTAINQMGISWFCNSFNVSDYDYLFIESKSRMATGEKESYFIDEMVFQDYKKEKQKQDLFECDIDLSKYSYDDIQDAQEDIEINLHDAVIDLIDHLEIVPE